MSYPDGWFEVGRAWTAPDGAVFPWVRWPETPPAPPRFVLVGVHGLTGRSLDMAPLGPVVTRLGGVLYSFELRSQGTDPEPRRRGDLISPNELPGDVAALLRLAAQRHPGVPLFIAGESMGSIVCLNLLGQPEKFSLPPLAGFLSFVSVPVLEVNITPALRMLIDTVVALLPTLRFPPQLFTPRNKKDARVTQLEDYHAYLKNAPHRVRTFTIRFWRHLGEMIFRCPDCARRITLPTLYIYAGHDVFITPEASKAFAELIAASDKEVHFFPNAYHLTLYDPSTPAVLAVVEAWLQRQLKLVAKAP